MQGMDGVSLIWQGKAYPVPGDRMMELILRIEDALRGNDRRQAVQILLAPGGPSVGRLALAYAEALKYAGAKVTPKEVYDVLQDEWAEGEAEGMTTAQVAVMEILALISPPMHRKLDALLKAGASGEQTPQDAD